MSSSFGSGQSFLTKGNIFDCLIEIDISKYIDYFSDWKS